MHKSLWEELKIIVDTMNEAWLVSGDFNDIASLDEKKGGVKVSICKCNIFKECINNCKLLDLVASGHKFTWRGPIYHGG